MKKTILLLLPAMMALAACGSGEQGLSKGSVFNEKVMANTFAKTGIYDAEISFQANKKVAIELGTNIQSVETIGGDSQWVTVTRLNDSSDLVKNVYDLVNKKYLGSWTLATEWINPTVKSQNNVKVLVITELNSLEYESDVYDQYGEEVYDGKFQANQFAINVTSYTNKNKEQRPNNEYYEVRFAADGLAPVTFVYDIEGQKTTKIVATDYDFLSTTTSLRDYGHPELKIIASNDATAKGTRYVTYNVEKKQYVSSFFVPDSDVFFRIGDYHYYQHHFELEERATDYDYYTAGKKYDFETHRVDYTTGEDKVVDFKYVMLVQSKKDIRDEDNLIKYVNLSNLRVIKDDKTLDPVSYSKVFDKDLSEVADITAVDFRNLKVFGKNYIAPNGVIYNANLEEVAYVPGYVNAAANKSCRIFQLNGAYGLVNYEGKIILTPRYTYIAELANGNYFANDGAQTYLFKVVGDPSANQLESVEEVTHFSDYHDVLPDAQGAYIFGFKEVEGVDKVFYMSIQDGSAVKQAELATGETAYPGVATTVSTHLGFDTLSNVKVVKDSAGNHTLRYNILSKKVAYYE